MKQVSLDLRGEVFCHGTLYVALSRTACLDNILCLVHPDRLIDNVPYVHNLVYSDFIVVATGQKPPTFDLQLCLPTADGTQPAPSNNCGSDNNNSSDQCNGSSDTDGSSYDGTSTQGNGGQSNQGHWSIVPEIGDGACILRCISRRIHNTPDLHHVIRSDIMTISHKTFIQSCPDREITRFMTAFQQE